MTLPPRSDSRASTPEPEQPATVAATMQWMRRRLVESGVLRMPEGAGPAALEQAEAEQSARAQAEAEWLVEWAAGWGRSRLVYSLQEGLPQGVWSQLTTALERRTAGEPLQYIIGWAPFYGREFVVRPGCLIPRPETEILLEEAVAFVQAAEVGHGRRADQQGQQPGTFGDAVAAGRGLTVVDIGTGSGALAVTLKLECPTADVVAVDVSSDALSIAQENARRQGATVRVVRKDALAWLEGLAESDAMPGQVRLPGQTASSKQAGRESSRSASAPALSGIRPDVLVSNPPYIPSGDIANLAEDVRAHEPRLALDGGDDGLRFYRAFARAGSRLFARNHRTHALFLEVGAGQAEDVLQLFEEAAARDLWTGWKFEVINDLRGIPRVVRGIGSAQ